jgi:hypothetical protein
LKADDPQDGVLTAKHLGDDDANSDGSKAEADRPDDPNKTNPVTEDHNTLAVSSFRLEDQVPRSLDIFSNPKFSNPKLAAPAASPVTDEKDRSKLSYGNNNFENYDNIELLSRG